jgi:adenylylsulfate kinase
MAQLLARALQQRHCPVEVLDGDVVRATLSQGLGFSPADRETNLRRIAATARNLIDQGMVAVVAAICPYHEIRAEVRAFIGEYVEVYLNCPLEVCIRRDPKGLYRRALAEEIQHFTGISDVFEPPRRPDIEVPTHTETPEESLRRILRGLEALGRLSPAAAASWGEDNSEAVPPAGVGRASSG